MTAATTTTFPHAKRRGEATYKWLGENAGGEEEHGIPKLGG